MIIALQRTGKGEENNKNNANDKRRIMIIC
jgi:hypothetical protein